MILDELLMLHKIFPVVISSSLHPQSAINENVKMQFSFPVFIPGKITTT